MIQFADLGWFHQIKAHAESRPDEEVCGVIIHNPTTGGLTAIQVPNIAEDPRNRFKISPDVYIPLYTSSEVLAVYHSHTKDSPAQFSEADKAASEECEMPYLLFADGDMQAYVPSILKLALYNRRFLPLVFDCLSLCEHYIEKRWKTPVTPVPRTLLTVNDIPRNLLATIQERKLIRTDRPSNGAIAVIATKGGLPDHAGIVVDGMLLHQLNHTGSREEPLHGWEKRILYYIQEPK